MYILSLVYTIYPPPFQIFPLLIYFFPSYANRKGCDNTVCNIIPIAFTSKDLGKVLITTSPASYKQWIQDWIKQPLEAANRLRVPAEASEITTPLIVDNWHIMLVEYPNRTFADFFISGIQEGFQVGFTSFGSSQQNGTNTV